MIPISPIIRGGEVKTPVMQVKPLIKLAQIPNSQIHDDLISHHKARNSQVTAMTPRHNFISTAFRAGAYSSKHGSSIDTTRINHPADEVADDIRRSVRVPLKSQIKQRNLH